MATNPGKYNRIVTFQTRVTGQDEHGGEVFTWPNFKTTWARVRPLRGRELIAAKAAQSETTVMLYCRYIVGIDTTMRILYDGKYYNIGSIIDIDEKHEELEIMATTGVSEG